MTIRDSAYLLSSNLDSRSTITKRPSTRSAVGFHNHKLERFEDSSILDRAQQRDSERSGRVVHHDPGDGMETALWLSLD